MAVVVIVTIVRVSPVMITLPPVVSIVMLPAVVMTATLAKIAVPLENLDTPILSVSPVIPALLQLRNLQSRLLAAKVVAEDMVGIAMILAMTAATGDKLTIRD